MCQNCESGEMFDDSLVSRPLYDRRTLLRRGLVASALAGAGLPLLVDVLSAAAAGGSTTATTATTVAPDAVGVPWATQVGPLNLTGPPAPSIVTRAQWGADESIRTDTRAFAPIRKLVVHHTASPSNPSDPIATMRMMYRYHVVDRGYDDIGYNFAIDQHGTIYEGRYARDYAPGEAHTGEATDGWGVVGGHALGMNCGTCGIVLIGDFSTGRPTAAAQRSLIALLAWKAGRHQIDVTGNDVYVPLYGGTVRRTPNLAGHRDIGVTACPGGGLYSLLAPMRQQIVKTAGSWPALTVDNPRVARFIGTHGPPVTQVGNAALTAGPQPIAASSVVIGYRILASNGSVKSIGAASTGGASGPATAIVGTPHGDGYRVLTGHGDVVGHGGAASLSTIGGKGPGDAVDMDGTASGNGYWIVTSGGGVYHFGDAKDAGSPRRQGVNDARKIAGTASGAGYWVLLTDGSIRNYGDAPNLGAGTPSSGLGIDIASTPSGKGYWLLLSNGDVKAYGDAPSLGGLSRTAAKGPVAIAATPSGKGYVIVSSSGTLTSFGDAPRLGAFDATGMTPVDVAIVSR